MALKGFWDRLRGKDPAPEPQPATPPAAPPVTPPPAQPATPTVPGLESPPAPPSPPIAPLPPAPGLVAPFTTPAEPAPAAPEPHPPAPPRLPPADPAGALQEALASSEPEPASGGGWFGRLRSGLARSTARLTDALTTVFRKRRLDDAALEELEDTLITADLGVQAARRIVEGFRRTRFGKEVSDEEVKAALAEAIAEILAPVAKPLDIRREHAPHVVLVVGVNGTGKTTTIAKLGQQYRDQGLSVMFAAGDTFRAAAVEQLQIWGDRTGCTVVAPAKMGADAAGLAHDALARARAEGTDLLLIDTAGRLHNKSALMEELAKIIRVIRKLDPAAPHSVLLTLDATTGQNALQQVKTFKEMVSVSGLAVTKLDGSAKGGVVVALAQEIGLPVHFVGVGEKAADLRPFTARDFARGLVGLGPPA
ncbi:signal recognition particle-docking protein FtsY [Roseomonas sp. BU-1]|uniref:Signal recognition particle receptor FtsY n=1 Tax=Falsiroseomonas selenitidurans TaxID=2716335 RepID=A0ABX1DXN3_9PROT|nr:signal recognition particle-docking protein FtsY [Falsiroseomonas selenitidurans]NKC29660.1 signal recognition particle-docking protein FtsY [Falsiroseomonas selenitidurans]